MSPPNENDEGRAPHHQGQPSPSELNNHHITGTSKATAPTTTSPGSALVWLPCTSTHPQDPRSQLNRRRDAKNRSVPLDCGCGTRDPMMCRCTEPRLTNHALDGWADAARHLLAAGQMPVVPLEVRRALWQRPADRLLAETLHAACDGEVA
jgi:hypothetical protein